MSIVFGHAMMGVIAGFRIAQNDMAIIHAMRGEIASARIKHSAWIMTCCLDAAYGIMIWDFEAPRFPVDITA